MLGNPEIRTDDCLRLALLFILRYETQAHGEFEHVQCLQVSRGVNETELKFLRAILEYGGVAKRTSELFITTAPLAVKKFFKGLKGVENVYTRHKPYLVEVLESLIRGKLKEVQYPYAGEYKLADRPQDIIVFMVGGATYAEAEAVANLNKTTQGVRIILGEPPFTIVAAICQRCSIPHTSSAMVEEHWHN